MRRVFCQALVEAATRSRFLFLTGDLSFMALGPLRDAPGDRFINAGVTEQNMVSIGAGLARAGGSSLRSQRVGPACRLERAQGLPDPRGVPGGSRPLATDRPAEP
jgi:transketolase C-terminal domain/subunit